MTHRAWVIQTGTDDEGRVLWWTNDTSTMESSRAGDAYDCGDLETATEIAREIDGESVPILLHDTREPLVTAELIEQITGASGDEAGGIAEEINAAVLERAKGEE